MAAGAGEIARSLRPRLQMLDARLSRRAGAAVVALFAAMVVLFLWPSLFGGKTLSSGDVILFQPPFDASRPATLTRSSNSLMGDPVTIMQPDLLVTRRALASGQLPLWNPDAAAGRPLLASQQHAPVFPLNWLGLVMSFWHSLAWTAALKLMLAAGGTFLLARWCGLPRGPAALAGTALALGSYTISWLQYPLSTSIAMTPWVMLAAGRAARLGRGVNAAGLGVAGGLLLLGGHAETAAIGLLFTIPLAAFELLRPRLPGAAGIGRRLAMLAAGAGLAVMLAAVMLVPLGEFLQHAVSTVRGGEGPPPHSTIYAYFFPELWGRADKSLDFGPVNFSERTAYVGVLPVVLGLAGIVARRPRGMHLFWILFAVGAFAVGYDTTVRSLINDVPRAKTINFGRVLFVDALSLAMLGGFGLQAWLIADRRGQRRMLAAIAVVTLAPVAFLLRHSSPFDHLGAALSQLPALGRNETRRFILDQAVTWRWMIIAALGVGALLLARRVPRRYAAVLAVVLLAADLITMDSGYVPSVAPALANPPITPALAFLQTHHGHQRVSGTLSTTPFGESLEPNLAERFGLPDVQSYDLPVVKRTGDLLAGYGEGFDNFNAWVPQAPGALRELNAMSVRYVVAPPGQAPPAGLKPVFTQGPDTILENTTALPRAWVAYSWRPVPNAGDAVKATVGSSARQLETQPVLEGVGAPPSGPATAPVAADFVVDDNERVVLSAQATQPGYVILNDTYYPGWTARVDGHSARIVAANENFRAVAVGPGSHTITFRYRPASAIAGGLISGLTALGVLAAAGLLLLRRRHMART